jgi:hypothetical protein
VGACRFIAEEFSSRATCGPQFWPKASRAAYFFPFYLFMFHGNNIVSFLLKKFIHLFV